MNYFHQDSPRLLFRKVEETDIPSWTNFFVDNDSLPFLGIDLSKDKETLATEWIMKQFERYEYQGLGHLAVIEKSSGTFIGTGGIVPREIDGKKEFEIAYSLRQAYWGKGYGTEIAKQMKDFGFAANIAKRFVSIIDQQNLASIHVAQKNGMEILYETEYLGMQVFVFGIEK